MLYIGSYECKDSLEHRVLILNVSLIISKGEVEETKVEKYVKNK